MLENRQKTAMMRGISRITDELSAVISISISWLAVLQMDVVLDDGSIFTFITGFSFSPSYMFQMINQYQAKVAGLTVKAVFI